MNAVTEEPLRVDVPLGQRSYAVLIGHGLLGQPERWRRAIHGDQVLVVSNEIVAGLYLEKLRVGLAGLHHDTVILPDGEASKTLEGASRIFDALAAMRATRDVTIIALGGGVIGDLAGFAAACWMRGVAVLQIPTTLLAMVDSSVGGKTAVNMAAGKNLIGAFHQPSLVLADTATLASLPPREYRSGLAEVVKYGAMQDADFLEWLDQNSTALLQREPDAVAQAVAASCRYKAAIVARDEEEQGERALLNFGHTFAHALETESGYGQLLHGEAVAIGMVLATRLSALMGMADLHDAQRLAQLLDRLALPTRLPVGISTAALLGHMQLDKKNRAGQLRLVLWHGAGRAFIAESVDTGDIRAVLDEARVPVP